MIIGPFLGDVCPRPTRSGIAAHINAKYLLGKHFRQVQVDTLTSLQVSDIAPDHCLFETRTCLIHFTDLTINTKNSTTSNAFEQVAIPKASANLSFFTHEDYFFVQRVENITVSDCSLVGQIEPGRTVVASKISGEEKKIVEGFLEHELNKKKLRCSGGQ